MERLASDADEGDDDFEAYVTEWRHNMFSATAGDALAFFMVRLNKSIYTGDVSEFSRS